MARRDPRRSTKSLDAFRSDSGAIGAQLEDAHGLGDENNVVELTQTTKDAILAEGLTDLRRVDAGGYGVVLKAKDATTGNPRRQGDAKCIGCGPTKDFSARVPSFGRGRDAAGNRAKVLRWSPAAQRAAVPDSGVD